MKQYRCHRCKKVFETNKKFIDYNKKICTDCQKPHNINKHTISPQQKLRAKGLI